MTYLENPGESIPRYPDQQILYQWPKHKQLPKLPHGAFYGQCDPFANGDEWIMVKAGAAITGPALLTPNGVILSNDSNTKMSRAYTKGDIRVYCQNGGSAAIAENALEGDTLHLGNNFINRITGNSAAAAASGSNYPEFWVELEYPFSKDFTVQTIANIPNPWKSVKEFTSADDKIVAALPDATTITSGYAFWAKVAGDILVTTSAAVSKSEALQLSGTAGKVQVHAAGKQIVAIANKAIAANATGAATLALGLI